MPRHNLIRGKCCKIRKRGSSSSSSTSSILQNYRFKRALLINKRGGSSTPILKMPQSPNYPPMQSGGGRKGKQAPVSARKLAATLWEMNQMTSVRLKDDLEEKRVDKESRSRDRVARSVQSGYLPQHLSDPSHSPVSEKMERSGIGSHYARTSNVSQKMGRTGHKIGALGSLSNASFMEIETRSRGLTPTGSIFGVKSHLKDLSNGMTTSKELLTVLSRMWGIEEQYSSGKSIISALRTELERARDQVDHLIQEQRSNQKEMYYLMKHFTEEKATWKRKVHERVETAVKSISHDLDMERKLRKRTDSLTKALGRELAETKASLSNVVKELESEKRAREIMEQVGDDLARGIGEDRALVEQLKKESVKVREEVEKEREMLQLADMLREERVHMKLLEAKYQFEEKSAAVDKLRNELEAFLRTKEAKESQNSCHNCSGIMEVAGNLVSAVAAYQSQQIGKGKREIDYGEGSKDSEVEDDSNSTESDLHSIELNMDNNNRNYLWNYANRFAQEDQKRPSVCVDKDIKGRNSTCAKRGGRVISLERCTSDGIEWELGTENCTSWGDGRRYSKTEKPDEEKNIEFEKQRHKSIKDLRDYIVSNSRLASTHGLASPTKQWGEI